MPTRFFRELGVIRRWLQVRQNTPTDLLDQLQPSIEVRPLYFWEDFDAGIIGYVIRADLTAIAARFGTLTIGLVGPAAGPGSYFTVEECRVNVVPAGGFVQCGIGAIPVGNVNGSFNAQTLDNRMQAAAAGNVPTGLSVSTQDTAGITQADIWELRAVGTPIFPRTVIQSQAGGVIEVWNMQSSIANQAFNIACLGRIFIKGRGT